MCINVVVVDILCWYIGSERRIERGTTLCGRAGDTCSCIVVDLLVECTWLCTIYQLEELQAALIRLSEKLTTANQRVAVSAYVVLIWQKIQQEMDKFSLDGFMLQYVLVTTVYCVLKYHR